MSLRKKKIQGQISHFPFPISHFPFPISHFPFPISLLILISYFFTTRLSVELDFCKVGDLTPPDWHRYRYRHRARPGARRSAGGSALKRNICLTAAFFRRAAPGRIRSEGLDCGASVSSRSRGTGFARPQPARGAERVTRSERTWGL